MPSFPKPRALAAALLLLFGSQAAWSQSMPAEVTLPAKTSTMTVGFPQGELVLYWQALGKGDLTVICGVAVPSSGQASRNTRAVLQKAFIKVDGKKIMRDLNHFRRLKIDASAVGETAPCRTVKLSGKGRRFELGIDRFYIRN